MFNGALIFRKLSETSAEKRRHIFDQLVRQYGSAESIPLEAWRSILPTESYRVCRLNGMESINGTLTKNYLPGSYSCICCGSDLFDAKDKYGMLGWLSFSRCNEQNIIRVPDDRYGLKRTEVCCKTCNSHLGFLYKDDISETKLRFTVNSAALDFNVEKYDTAVRKHSIQSL